MYVVLFFGICVWELSFGSRCTSQDGMYRVWRSFPSRPLPNSVLARASGTGVRARHCKWPVVEGISGFGSRKLLVSLVVSHYLELFTKAENTARFSFADNSSQLITLVFCGGGGFSSFVSGRLQVWSLLAGFTKKASFGEISNCGDLEAESAPDFGSHVQMSNTNRANLKKLCTPSLTVTLSLTPCRRNFHDFSDSVTHDVMASESAFSGVTYDTTVSIHVALAFRYSKNLLGNGIEATDGVAYESAFRAQLTSMVAL